MTIQFDKKSAKELKVQKKLFNPLEYNGMKVKDMKVRKVDASFCRPYIATYHYSKIMPDNAFECYAGFYGEKLAGVVVFGNGANNLTFTALIKDIKLQECRELMRLWSADCMPKNTESKLISESIKLLPKNVKMIVSFADPSHNHLGIIYQASNFMYCGKSHPSKMLMDKNGLVFHIRSIGTYKRRHPELQGMSNLRIMDKYGWKYVNSAGKHRYVFLRCSNKEKKKMMKELRKRILPYPKCEVSIKRDTSDFQSEEVGAVPTPRTQI